MIGFPIINIAHDVFCTDVISGALGFQVSSLGQRTAAHFIMTGIPIGNGDQADIMSLLDEPEHNTA